MASNQGKIVDHYKHYKESDRATGSRANGLEFHYTKKLLANYITLDSRVIELGCATGYYGMYFADQCTHYTGIDLSPDNIAIFEERIAKEGRKNISAAVGDATALPGVASDAFDIVLCLGPLYHVPQEERMRVVRECYRIAKKGAILAFAYINSIGVYAGWCVNEEGRDTYPNARANKYFLEQNVAYDNPEVFFLTSPEEMVSIAEQNHLEIVKNCGLDFFFAQSVVNRMDDDQFALYMELSDRMVDSPSCTGLSDHALLICKK